MPTPPVTATDITPTLTDVGAILRARTRNDDTGDESGTFSTNTRPTGAEVSTFITAAAELVSLRLGTRIPAGAMESARLAVTLRAAYMVELSLEDDRSDNPDSAYVRLKALYDELMRDLQDSLLDAGDATTSRIGSMSIVSPTLATLPDDWRIAEQGPYV